MKTVRIKRFGDLYAVFKVPNFIEILLGVKERYDLYRFKGEFFERFPHLRVFYNEKGEMLSFNDKICQELNNFSNQ